MADNCCYGCVAPKRYPGCQDHCPERQEQLAQRAKEMEQMRKANGIANGINNQKIEGIRRAMRRHGRK